MTTCDLCPAAAIWLLEAESPEGSGMTAVSCRRCIDIARALMARLGPPTVIPIDSDAIPGGTP
jgi:hypothetical protein